VIKHKLIKKNLAKPTLWFVVCFIALPSIERVTAITKREIGICYIELPYYSKRICLQNRKNKTDL